MKVESPHFPISLLLAIFVLLGLAYSVVNPLHEATDELRHYRFVRYLVANKSLPVQGQETCRSQSHHPPLIYVLGALATAGIDTGRDVCHTPEANPFWAYRLWEVGSDNKNQYLHGQDEAFPWQGEALAAHIVRAINVLFGAAVVYCTWLTGRMIWPFRPKIPLIGAAIIAFNPMFVYMSSAINNDIVAAFGSAIVMVIAVKMLFSAEGITPRWGIWLGIGFGIALLSKFNNAALLGIIECALLWVALWRKQWKQFIVANIVLIGATLLVAGWWFVRNQLLYGEPTGVRILTELWGVRDPSESWGLAVSELPYAWSTLWGRFGFGQIPMPDWVYTTLRYFVGFGLAAGFVNLLSVANQALKTFAQPAKNSNTGTPQVGAILLLFGFVILFFAVLFNYMLISPAGPMGRFFFPGLPALALLIAFGWHGIGTLLQKLHVPLAHLLPALSALALVTLTLYGLIGILRPAYAQPAAWSSVNTLPNPVDIEVKGLGKIVSYQISQSSVAPGGAVDVTLHWEVTERPIGNFLWFVHLIDEVGFVTQRDTHPGTGTWPTGQWQLGDKFVDTVTLHVPEMAYGTDSAEISLGFYAPDAGYRLPIFEDGVGIGDTLRLGNVTIEDPNADFKAQNFNDAIALTGYRYSTRQLKARDTLTLELDWQALDAASPAYNIVLQVIDEQGKDWLYIKPELGNEEWGFGRNVTKSYDLILPSDIPIGIYTVDIAIIEEATGNQQNIIHPDGHWIDNHLPLAKIRVDQ